MPLQIKLTDRSRYETGEGKCRRERWLNYAWTNGYGLRRKKTSLPLATGIVYHEMLRPVLHFAQAQRQIPTTLDLIQLTTKPITDFYTLAKRKSVDFGVSEDRADHIAQEQIALSAGLTYAWTKRVLPWLLQQGRIVEIEREDVTVYACSCGLGDAVGTAEQHDARQCSGIGWQSRPDFIHEDLGGSLTYHDFKGTGWLNEGWRNAWPYKIQVMVGAKGAEQRLGRPIASVMIHGLYKGMRKGAYNVETRRYDGEKMQMSDLCYAFYLEPNPPFEIGGWKRETPTGKGARSWKRRGIWHYPGGMWTYFDTLPDEVLDASLILVGPFPVKERRARQFLTQMMAEEMRWGIIEDRLYEKLVACGGDWTHPEYRDLLDRCVPQSNDCYRFGKPCAFLPICDEEPGWENPLGIGYELRRPHHQPELEQQIARGLCPPEDPDEPDEEE